MDINVKTVPLEFLLVREGASVLYDIQYYNVRTGERKSVGYLQKYTDEIIIVGIGILQTRREEALSIEDGKEVANKLWEQACLDALPGFLIQTSNSQVQ